mgnify:CR=1 FL=1
MNGDSGFKALGRLLFTLILATGLHTVFLLGMPADPVLHSPAPTTLQINLVSQTPDSPPAPEASIEAAVETVTEPPQPIDKDRTPPEPVDHAVPDIKPKPELQAAAPIKTNTIRLASDATSKPDALKPATAPKTQQSPKPAKQRPTPEKIAPSPVKKPVPPKASALTQKTIPETKAEPSAPKISASSLLARSLSMARTTPLDELEPAPLGQRIKRLQGSRYNSALENSYLMHWREKVQRIGAINYPESARRQKLSGQLRLLVSLNADGTLDEVAILSPSKYPELDQAAIRIVQLSAPFRPFPVEMRKTTDRLEIIRVWKFENDTVVY